MTRLMRGCTFLSVDPGINHTGLAWYRIDTAGQLSLRECLAISPARQDDDLDRAGYIVEQLEAHVNTKRPAVILLERPPNTIYHQGRASRAMLIARAQSVFKVVGVTYAIAVRLRKFTGLQVQAVEPVQWQERSKAKRGGLAIKDWSLKLANSLITQLSNLPADLHTERDINIADAISMGYLTYQKLDN